MTMTQAKRPPANPSLARLRDEMVQIAERAPGALNAAAEKMAVAREEHAKRAEAARDAIRRAGRPAGPAFRL
jgi:hypothetical protein